MKEGWKNLSFDDIVKFSGGAQPPRSTFKFEETSGYIRLIQTRDYKSDKYITYIPIDFARKRCKPDDVMIGRYGPPVFQILRGLEGAYNVALIKATPKKANLLNEYLFYYISQYKIWAFIDNLSQRSGGQTGVDLNQLKKYSFPLPPLIEQEKIVNILSLTDEKIEIIEQKITEAENLKKGLMQRLLTRGIGHEEFKDSVLGEIPVSWEVVNGDDISIKITKGSSPKWQGFDYQESGLLFVTSKNVRRGELNIKTPKFLPIEFGKKAKNSNLKNNDILINIVGASIGRSCLYKSDYEFANINQAVCLLRTNSTVIPNYILQFLQNEETVNRLLGTQNGSARQNLSLTDIKRFKFIVPPLPEQQQIEKILSTADEKIEVLRDKATAYRELKRGLMQQLLTGKIRVKTEA